MLVFSKLMITVPGTKLKYKPGILMGGKHHVHDCGVIRAIGYFLEPLIVLGLFGKKPLSIRLKGTVYLSYFDLFFFLFFILLLTELIEVVYNCCCNV